MIRRLLILVAILILLAIAGGQDRADDDPTGPDGLGAGAMIGFTHDDGGRAAAGFVGQARDCAVRAIAIAAERPYADVYDELTTFAKSTERRGSQGSHARTGVYATTMRRYMLQLGWQWTPTMQIGSGCTVHLRADELPAGRIIVSLSKHYAAVVDGVVHDVFLDDRGGTRCVYGYWNRPERNA